MTKPLILVVDDEPDMANLIAKNIRETERYETVIAHNGLEAFEILDKNKRFLGLAENKIKCIILDLKMPEMDGLQFIRKLRRDEAWFKLMPVIVLTAYEDEEKWMVTTHPAVGLAAAYLKKPFNKQELIDTVDRVFQEEIGHMIDETREKKYKKLEELKKEKKQERN
ncbi:MAG: response regulator [Candidatus Margulisbacteria bacterium]|nr:response regulator [Candidatus Margulisiibacteriota bacterium]